MKTLLVFLIISSTLMADDNAVWLNKNDSAPYEGLLLKETKAQDVRIKLLERESFARQIELYKSNESIYMEQLKITTDQNNNLAKSLNDERSSSTWSRVALILTGVLLTVGAGVALRQASK